MNTHTYDPLPKYRLLGRVEWYGGSTKAGLEMKYGFIQLAANIETLEVEDGIFIDQFETSLFVHESDLNCSPSALVEHKLVTFRLIRDKERLKATDLDLLDNERDIEPLLDVIQLGEASTIDEKLLACSRLTEETYPLARPDILSFMSQLDDWNQNSVWRNHKTGDYHPFDFQRICKGWANGDHFLYEALPKYIKSKLFLEKNDDLSSAFLKLTTINSIPGINSLPDYRGMSDKDRQLASTWVRDRTPHEQAKMLSARYAELAVARFFRSLNQRVDDIAMHQLTGQTDAWRNFDLLIDGKFPVDVKNARNTIKGNTFVQYTVKKFKQTQENVNVQIFGVLSPYKTLEKMNSDGDENVPRYKLEPIRLLGQTNSQTITALEQEFSKRGLRIDFGPPDKWPVWVFENSLEWFDEQKEAILIVRKHAGQILEQHLEKLGKPILFLLPLCGIDPPQPEKKFGLLPWQVWFWRQLTEKGKKNDLTLPWVYLFIFHHFIEAITNVESAERQKFSPNGYFHLLFDSTSESKPKLSAHRTSTPNRSRPLGLIDNLETVDKLIKTLSVLWKTRHITKISSLSSFVLKGEGLLQATTPNGQKVSIVAYCGGFIPTKGKCGNSPLIKGHHPTCEECGKLICDMCGHCSTECRK